MDGPPQTVLPLSVHISASSIVSDHRIFIYSEGPSSHYYSEDEPMRNVCPLDSSDHIKKIYNIQFWGHSFRRTLWDNGEEENYYVVPIKSRFRV